MIKTIEGRALRTPDDLHDALSVALELPDYYGRNLDALWDCLTSWVPMPTTVVWKDHAISKEVLGEFAERVIAVMREAAGEVDGFELRLE